MKIQRATIYGFGRWVDYTIDFSEQSFICIYGENESGKSTLQQFILFMLFGLPPKLRTFYRPKTSSAMGGRLTLVDRKIGEFTIERFDEVRNGAAICYTQGGQEYDESWLHDRLNGMTSKTYQSIFSFSATDLIGIQNMKEDDIGEVLLGIGLTGSTHIYAIEKRLDTKIGELFKPFGKNPIINQQVDTLNTILTNLTEFKNNEATYRSKREKAIDLTNEIDRLQKDLRQEKENGLLYEKMKQAMPYLHEYHAYRTQLGSLPAKIKFPENGLERLQNLKDKVLPLQSELSILKANAKQYIEKKAQLESESESMDHINQARLMMGKKQRYIENTKEEAKLEQLINKLDTQINVELDEMAIGLTSEKLASITFPFHIEKTWNELKNGMDQLAIEKEQLKQEKHLTTNKNKYLDSQVKEMETKLLSTDQKSRLQNKINEHKEYDLLQKLHESSAEKAEKWQKNKGRTKRKHNGILIGSIVFASISMVLALFTESAILINISIISVIFGCGQWLWGIKTIQDMEKMFHSTANQLPALFSTRTEKEEAEHLLMIDNENRNEQSLLNEQLKSTNINLIQIDEKNEVLKQKENRLASQISEQQELYPFLKKMEVQYWPEVYHTLRNLLRIHREKEELEQQYQVVKNDRILIINEVERFVHERNWESDSKTIESYFEQIAKKINQFTKATNSIADYRDLIVENEEQQQEVRQKLETYEREISDLLMIAKVTSEDEFYKNANQLKDQQQLKLALEKISAQFSSIFSDEDWKDLIEKIPRQSTLELNLEQCETAMLAIESDLDAKRQQLADVNADLTQMESSESYSNTMHQFEMEQERINKLAKEWAILKTAKEMLVETKWKFRDKYLNRVMEQAAYYFKHLTGDTYIRVYPPTESKPFSVEDQNRIRYAVNELSQGTIDQLYVSLRLAISEIMSKNYRMPFIIDDAFVHFDSIRMQRIITILNQIAEDQQIILFTCKNDLVESAQNAEIIELKSPVRLNR